MGTVLNLDAKIAGTTDPRRLAVMVKLLGSGRINAAQAARLAAAKRLMEKTDGS